MKTIVFYTYLLNSLLIGAGCDGSVQKGQVKTSDTTIVHQPLDKSVSLITLVGTPEKYNGQQVRVKGFLNLEFEGNGVYLHKEDYDLGIDKNALWIDLEGAKVDSTQYKICNKHYVILEGTFQMNNKGHHGSYSGAITKINRIDLLNH
jgi:hypothetical protein